LALWKPQVLPQSPIGQTITYAQGQWVALNRCVDDSILAIDNNLAERTLRMVASGRKNWLFVRNDSDGYSLMASCKLCGIDPSAGFRGVLERIGTRPAGRIAGLIPRNWKPSCP
jgi:transposase